MLLFLCTSTSTIEKSYILLGPGCVQPRLASQCSRRCVSFTSKKAAPIEMPMVTRYIHIVKIMGCENSYTLQATRPSNRNTPSYSINSKRLGLYDAPRYPTAWTGPPVYVPEPLLPSFGKARKLLAALGVLGSRHAKKVVKSVKDAHLMKVTVHLIKHCFS